MPKSVPARPHLDSATNSRSSPRGKSRSCIRLSRASGASRSRSSYTRGALITDGGTAWLGTATTRNRWGFDLSSHLPPWGSCQAGSSLCVTAAPPQSPKDSQPSSEQQSPLGNRHVPALPSSSPASIGRASNRADSPLSAHRADRAASPSPRAAGPVRRQRVSVVSHPWADVARGSSVKC
jgi:hypothetical protein